MFKVYKWHDNDKIVNKTDGLHSFVERTCCTWIEQSSATVTVIISNTL